MLDGSLDGLKAKVRALLGRDLPEEMLTKQDPYYPLDFNNAPNLDAIYITYLVFRRDLYGTIMERLLRFHAERGTLVKIFTSKVISLDKDMVMLNDLEIEYPNVMVKLYKFDSFNAEGPMELFSQLHRTLHVKMFMTSSESSPENNVVHIGGRNIHDGFVFDTIPNLKKYPELVQYGEGKDENFAKWTDFEVELKGKRVLKSLMGHYESLFEHDSEDFFFRSYTLNRRTNAILDESYLDDDKILFRHMMSFPYKDGKALEKVIVELLNSAQETITLSTPYFNLTPNIDKALLKAVERDVKVDIITRLDLDGDTADIILSDVNKKSVNKYVDNIVIYEYTRPADILHSKLIVVDKKMTFVGSVNFNQRSFFHDLENTLMIRSPKFSQKIIKLIDFYKQSAREITEEQKTVFWKSIVIGIFKEAL
jgi:cardiolipin synthase